MLNYNINSIEQSEEFILKILFDESAAFFKKDSKFDRYSRMYFEDIDSQTLQKLYSEPNFVGTWNYDQDTHNLFSLFEVFRDKNNISGIILDNSGIALAKGELKIGKEDWIKKINIKKKYLSTFPHKNEYIMNGINTILIPDLQHKLSGRIYIKNNEKALFNIERPPNSATIEKLLHDIYLSNLHKIK